MYEDIEYGVTGRDDDIIAKALAYAITVIDGLPDLMREASDAEDMRLLLGVYAPTINQQNWKYNNARAHLGLPLLPIN